MMETGRHWSGAERDSGWMTEAESCSLVLGACAAEHDRRGEFVAGGFDELRRRGLLSMLVPSELGGGGATHGEACAVLAALAVGCPATALTLSMHSHLVAAQVWRQKHDLPAPMLARIATEQLVLISTGAADWLDSHGSASRVEGGFRVTARKAPSSGCPAGDVLVSSARWEDGPDPRVVHFVIPFASDGITIDETWDTMGMRGTGSHTVVLDDVYVPDESVSLTRPAGEWHPVFSTIVGAALPLITAVYVGIAEAAVARATALASKRTDVALVAPLVGRMANRLTVARDAVGAMIALSENLGFSNTMEHTAAVLTRKTIAIEAAIDAVRLAMEVAGGVGYSTFGGIERLYRDVHGGLYHPLPAAKQERFTGLLQLGLDPLSAG